MCKDWDETSILSQKTLLGKKSIIYTYWEFRWAIVLTAVAVLSEGPNYKLLSANFQLQGHVFALGSSSMYIHSIILGMSWVVDWQPKKTVILAKSNQAWKTL